MPTLLDKLWQNHLVPASGLGQDLIYIDRHYVHEVTSPQAFDALRRAGRRLRRPDLTWAVIDHNVPTDRRDFSTCDEQSRIQLEAMIANCAEFGLDLVDLESGDHGIVHVTAPELGLTLPGHTIVAGDSHTATHGAFGALALGIGSSQVEHVMATQTLALKKPGLMEARLLGEPGPAVHAKDLVLALIAHVGVAGGAGQVLLFSGPAVERLSMEGRMTLCNMAVECSARTGLIAPDAVTFEWLRGRRHAPAGAEFDQAVAAWRELAAGCDSPERVVELNAAAVEPMATWGTNPGQAAPIASRVPDPGDTPDPEATRAALAYMDLKPGQELEAVPIDFVFIGSCTNGRLEDLRAAARVLQGAKKAPGVSGIVVPGSVLVKQQAEAEGLHEVFMAAGLQWRHPGCSMCLAMNPDVLPPGVRCASTSNRNFQDRQGRGARTHLMSPASAAASAVAGRLASAA